MNEEDSRIAQNSWLNDGAQSENLPAPERHRLREEDQRDYPVASRSMKDLPHQKVGNGDNSGKSQNIELRADQACGRKTLEADDNLIYQGRLIQIGVGEIWSGWV